MDTGPTGVYAVRIVVKEKGHEAGFGSGATWTTGRREDH